MRITHTYPPLLTTFTIALTTLTLAACGGSSNNSKNNNHKPITQVEKKFDCANSDEAGARIICIGSADELSDSAVQKQLLEALAQAETGDTYVLPQGRYNFDRTVEYNGMTDNTPVSHLTFKGAGMDKTIIDTSNASADGFLINNTDNLIFEDFGIYESNNNALKIKNSDGIIIRRMATVWETDYQSTNGAYGMYPVETQNVLIEDSFVKGSADAGIYVGQSDNIVVRNNIAEKNVAGIEIENSTRADVYGNKAIKNTGGILIFDLPIGNGKYGEGVRVFNNHVENNNAPNFANKSSFAGGVHIVPPGTGVIVLSTSDVEIFNNVIKDHQTTSIAVTSYLLADESIVDLPNPEATSYGSIHPFANIYMDGWSPLVRNINVHNNDISVAEGVNKPEGDLIADIIQGYQIFHAINPDVASGKTTIPHILYDGAGELLANTPNPGGEGESILQAIVGGINQIAEGVKNNNPDAGDYTPIDLSKFAAYEQVNALCQSSNGIDDLNLFAASVFETTPQPHSFDENGNPLSKLELLFDKELVEIAADIMADTKGVMLCEEAYQGSPVTVIFDNEEFGCTSDDASNPTCSI